MPSSFKEERDGRAEGAPQCAVPAFTHLAKGPAEGDVHIVCVVDMTVPERGGALRDRVAVDCEARGRVLRVRPRKAVRRRPLPPQPTPAPLGALRMLRLAGKGTAVIAPRSSARPVKTTRVDGPASQWVARSVVDLTSTLRRWYGTSPRVRCNGTVSETTGAMGVMVMGPLSICQ